MTPHALRAPGRSLANVAALICGSIAAGLLLTGCNNGGNAASDPPKAADQAAGQKAAAGQAELYQQRKHADPGKPGGPSGPVGSPGNPPR